jgi:hypothetical protein
MVTYDPKCCEFIRRWSPHAFYNAYFDLDGKLSTASGHWHAFDIQQANGGRFGIAWTTAQDNPREPFPLYSDTSGRTVVVPPGDYSWNQARIEWDTDQSANLWLTIRADIGTYYGNGRYVGWESTYGARLGARFVTTMGGPATASSCLTGTSRRI